MLTSNWRNINSQQQTALVPSCARRHPLWPSCPSASRVFPSSPADARSSPSDDPPSFVWTPPWISVDFWRMKSLVHLLACDQLPTFFLCFRTITFLFESLTKLNLQFWNPEVELHILCYFYYGDVILVYLSFQFSNQHFNRCKQSSAAFKLNILIMNKYCWLWHKGCCLGF